MSCKGRNSKFSNGWFTALKSGVPRYVAFPELPGTERLIGERVKIARKRVGLTQKRLADWIGVSRDQLNNIEIGRVALRFEPGWEICRQLDLNPLWLAEGQEEIFGFVDVPGVEFNVDSILFSTVMSDMSDPRGESYSHFRKEKLGLPARDKFQFAAETLVAKWQKDIRPEDYDKFLRHIAVATRKLLRESREDVNQQLTKAHRHKMNSPVNLTKASLWPELRERLRQAVKRRGMKAALARDIGITRQAVNAMLRSNKQSYTPSAEFALRLDDWSRRKLDNQPKKKRAGTASTEPARKIQKSKSNYEKAKSNQKKQ